MRILYLLSNKIKTILPCISKRGKLAVQHQLETNHEPRYSIFEIILLDHVVPLVK